jgi:dimethylargininase
MHLFSALFQSFKVAPKSTFLNGCRPFSSPPQYSVAISREIPSSFGKAITKFANSEEPIDVTRTKSQKSAYLKALRRYVPTICLPALEEHPDSVFVEDTVVAVGRRAVITNPGHPSRQGEVGTILNVLQQFGFEIVDMRNVTSAFCDGGDVLYTGRHLFVGLSERTSRKAVDVLAASFSGVDVRAVEFQGDALHLKSIVTHLDETTLFAPTGNLGDAVLEEMQAQELGYEIIRLPSMLACNVVAVNGGVLAQHTGCGESERLLVASAKDRGLNLEFVDMSEIAKADGALTCCSVLLQI